MAGCKRCALKGEKDKGKRREKKRKKEEKWESKSFVFFVLFFISPCACFFICAVVIFQICKENYI